MTSFAKHATATVLVLAVVGAAAGAAFVWSGIYDVGADSAHTAPVQTVLKTVRKRSIEVRAAKLQVPNLTDEARIVQGAGNYNAMCVGCHLAPGMTQTELSRGLYPAPPDLTKDKVDPAQAFWAIKHGIKASGMPAWGKSMDDEYVWSMAAFLQKLPGLDERQYREIVASSGGHSHGGSESARQHEGGAAKAAHDDGDGKGPRMSATDQTNGSQTSAPASASATPTARTTKRTVHVHADGSEHLHEAPAAKPQAPHPQDGHKH